MLRTADRTGGGVSVRSCRCPHDDWTSSLEFGSSALAPPSSTAQTLQPILASRVESMTRTGEMFALQQQNPFVLTVEVLPGLQEAALQVSNAQISKPEVPAASGKSDVMLLGFSSL